MPNCGEGLFMQLPSTSTQLSIGPPANGGLAVASGAHPHQCVWFAPILWPNSWVTTPRFQVYVGFGNTKLVSEFKLAETAYPKLVEHKTSTYAIPPPKDRLDKKCTRSLFIELLLLTQ